MPRSNLQRAKLKFFKIKILLHIPCQMRSSLFMLTSHMMALNVYALTVISDGTDHLDLSYGGMLANRVLRFRKVCLRNV